VSQWWHYVAGGFDQYADRYAGPIIVAAIVALSAALAVILWRDRNRREPRA